MRSKTWMTQVALIAGMCLSMAGSFLRAEPSDQDQPRPPRRGPMAGPRVGGPRDKAGPGQDGEGPRRPPRPRMRDKAGDGQNPNGQNLGDQADDGPPPLTQDMIDHVMEMVKEKFPILHARLTALQQNDPQRFDEAIHRLMFIHHEYRALKERNAQQAEKMIDGLRAEEKLYSLSDQYKAAAGDAQKQAALDQEISTVVRRQIELMQQRREERLTEFSQRLEKQRQRLEEERTRFQNEKSNIDQLVARRIQSVKEGKIRPGILEGGPPPGKDGQPGPRGARRGPPPGMPPPPPPEDSEDGPDGPPPMHPDDEPPPPPDEP